MIERAEAITFKGEPLTLVGEELLVGAAALRAVKELKGKKKLEVGSWKLEVRR